MTTEVSVAGVAMTPFESDSARSLTDLAATAADRALADAAVDPADVDAFTVLELIELEELGFYEPGTAWEATLDGDTALDGDLPADRAFVCADCGRRWYYDRRRCPECGRASADAATVPLETGSVVATTTVETTPPDVRAPNHLVLARFGEVQLIAQAVDGDLSPGDTVGFEGSHRLRESRERTDPQLVAVDDS